MAQKTQTMVWVILAKQVRSNSTQNAKLKIGKMVKMKIWLMEPLELIVVATVKQKDMSILVGTLTKLSAVVTDVQKDQNKLLKKTILVHNTEIFYSRYTVMQENVMKLQNRVVLVTCIKLSKAPDVFQTLTAQEKCNVVKTIKYVVNKQAVLKLLSMEKHSTPLVENGT